MKSNSFSLTFSLREEVYHVWRTRVQIICQSQVLDAFCWQSSLHVTHSCYAGLTSSLLSHRNSSASIGTEEWRKSVLQFTVKTFNTHNESDNNSCIWKRQIKWLRIFATIFTLDKTVIYMKITCSYVKSKVSSLNLECIMSFSLIQKKRTLID